MDLKKYRAKIPHLTQQKFAHALGVSRSTVAMWESGKNEPDNVMLTRIADYFHISTDELLGVAPNEKELVPKPTPSPITQLCEAYNLSASARAMIETIVAMSPDECEAVAEFAQRYVSRLEHKADNRR